MASIRREIIKKLLLSEITDDTEVIASVNYVKLSSTISARVAELESRQESNPDACVHNFVEEVIPLYSRSQFKEHFRMYPDVFEVRINCIKC